MIPVSCRCSGRDHDCGECARRVASFSDLLRAEEVEQAREIASSDPGLVLPLLVAILNLDIGVLPVSVYLLREHMRIAPFVVGLTPEHLEVTASRIVRLYFSDTYRRLIFNTPEVVSLVYYCVQELEKHFTDDPYVRARATRGSPIGDDPGK